MVGWVTAASERPVFLGSDESKIWSLVFWEISNMKAFTGPVR